MTPAQSAVIDAVQELRDERDYLLDLLRRVVTADCVTTPNGNHVAVITPGLMAEIHRRTN